MSKKFDLKMKTFSGTCDRCQEMTSIYATGFCLVCTKDLVDWANREIPLPSELSCQVRAFHKACGLPTAETPTIPSDERVRLRATLMAEEFIETLEAMFDTASAAKHYASVSDVKVYLGFLIRNCEVKVHLPALADGLADLDYINEGTRLEFGIQGAPIAAEVHRANMNKTAGPKSPTGKQLKPEGWTPPDIAGELREQGWKG